MTKFDNYYDISDTSGELQLLQKGTRDMNESHLQDKTDFTR